MAREDYTDLDKSHAQKIERQKIQPRAVGGLSLAALLVGILAIPAAIFPLVGVVVAAVAIVVGIIAVIRANRQGTQRSYAIIGLVLAVISMAMAIFFTQAAMKSIEGCETLRGTEFSECVKNNQNK
ncbi:DUF308 domain-containing protein [Corynebacterium macclintockiae]|uniref:DUF308 domain-containing protein n=1 Tax=Corynebacterium macclintockiae TaxID=2913501 RepID=UPI002550DF19|nr:DUF308 domain-containing protein [Corynebacterium macclintockiae]MDK8890468.1 DUF308 domain-containing protein [Corynebacterium macclintockiae]